MGKAMTIGFVIKGIIRFFKVIGENGNTFMMTVEKPGEATACKLCRDNNNSEHSMIRDYIKDVDVRSAAATETLREDINTRLDMVITLLKK